MASEENQIRRFRKKLRQIEHLESLRRELTEDELNKVATKEALRAQLQILLSQILQESETRKVPHISRTRYKLPLTPREHSFADNVKFEECVIVEPITNHNSDFNSNSETSDMRKRKLDESELEELQNENNENRSRGETSETQGTAGDNGDTLLPSATISGADTTYCIKKQRKLLENAQFVTTELKGHSDIVWSLASYKNVIVSGSRDTTARVWDSELAIELCSLRGHTGSVNGVAILGPELSQILAKELECDSNQIVFTASTDCSIRLWDIPSGKQLKSIYTFNSITCLGLLEDIFLAVTGTDGGKVEVWDVIGNNVIHSDNAHNESVMCLEVSGSQFCSGSTSGIVIIWKVLDKKVQILYKLDPDLSKDSIVFKSLKSVASHYGRLFLGDNGDTIKVISWRRERMHSVRNHTRKYGCTDALITFNDLLLSSSYNIDSGLGSINIRLLPEMEYICSIHEKVHRILCLTCSLREDGGLRIVSGGAELLVWDLLNAEHKKNMEKFNTADIIDTCHLECLDLEPEKQESEEESISDTTDDDQECINLRNDQTVQLETNKTNSWTRWCTLV